jgi:lipopolysaccharide transport system ATP-binding protein
MTKKEIDQKFDEIVAFSGIEKFLDTPVKRYSSGMGVRLAFAVAAHLEPEILLIDEVLAVGDAAFQKKCLGKMEDITSQGRTILFVSHNMAAIRHLCQKGIVLDSGAISYKGPMADCINHYLSGGHDNDQATSIISHSKNVHPGIEINCIQINGSELDRVKLPSDAKLLKIMISGRIKDEPKRVDMEAIISDSNEIPLGFFSPGHEKGEVKVYSVGHFEIVRNIELPRMMSGEYNLSLFLTDPGYIVWFDMRRAAKIIAEGTTTCTGLVFEYRKGVGWLFLSEAKE